MITNEARAPRQHGHLSGTAVLTQDHQSGIVLPSHYSAHGAHERSTLGKYDSTQLRSCFHGSLFAAVQGVRTFPLCSYNRQTQILPSFVDLHPQPRKWERHKSPT